MKKYLKELIVLALQLLLFYIFPLFAGPADAIGMVVLILCGTFLLSAVLSAISGNELKFLYPAAIAVVFIPSVFIYYNETALVHSVWYFFVAAIGVGIGAAIRWLTNKF